MPSLAVVRDDHRTDDERDRLVRAMLAAAEHRGPSINTVTAGAVTLGLGSRHDDDGDLAAADGWAAVVAGVLDEPVPGARPDEGSARALTRAVASTRSPERTCAGLRGSYAGVVTDGTRVWAFRDHVGSQPLFHRVTGGRVVLATEAKQVLVGADLPRQVDLDVVTQIFYGSYDDETPAALTGVLRLPKATLLHAGPGTEVSTIRYWDPAALVETRRVRDRQEVQETFDALLDRAVRRTLSGRDVVSLSGGVDAPAVAAFAAPATRERYGTALPALSTVYPDLPAVDESHWIELIASRLEMPLTTFVPSGLHLGTLGELGRLLDGPVPTVWFSEIDEFYRRTAALGRRRVLSGECAEFVIEMRAGLLPHLLSHGRLPAAARFLAARRRGGAHWGTLARSLAVAAAPDPLVHRLRTGPSPDVLTVPDFVDSARVDTVDPSVSSSKRRYWRDEQLRAFLGPGLSMEADTVVQDLHGILVRRPWMDVDLWEWFLSLRAEDKFPASRYKALVKDLLRGRLPDEVLDRRTFTTFNDAIMTRVDYVGLDRWLADPGWQVQGVDYGLLRRRLAARDLGLADYVWAKDLATAHAFVEG